MYFHIVCYFSDPGIIPRNHKNFIPKEEIKLTQEDGCCSGIINIYTLLDIPDAKLTEIEELGINSLI